MEKRHSINLKKSLSGRRSKDKRIWHFLMAELHLKSYSEEVLISLSKSFGISVEELKQKIVEFRAKGGRSNG